MRLHLPVKLCSALLLAICSVASVSSSVSAALYQADGVDVKNATKSTLFFDNGKGYYFSFSWVDPYASAKTLYEQTGSFNFLGDLKNYIVDPSKPISQDSFARLKDDANTCGRQVPANLIQYWLRFYGVFYKGSEKLPYGYTYDKKYLSALGGTQSLKVGMFLHDNWQNNGNSLGIVGNWFFKGTTSSLLLAGHPSNGGFFSNYFTANSKNGWKNLSPVSGSSYSKDQSYGAKAPTIENITEGLFYAFGYDPVTKKQVSKGQIVYFGMAAGDGGAGHAITCYGFETDAKGRASVLYVCNSDDMKYTIFPLYPKESNGAIRLYTNPACTTLWKYAGTDWSLSQISYINTPQELKDMLAEYEDTSNPLVWNGMKLNDTWDKKAGGNLDEKLPDVTEGWSIQAGGDYFYAYYDAKRPVEFNDLGVPSSGVATVKVTSAISAPQIRFTGTSDSNYRFTGTSGSISANSLYLDGSGTYAIAVPKFTIGEFQVGDSCNNPCIQLEKGSSLICTKDTTLTKATIKTNSSSIKATTLTIGDQGRLYLDGRCSFSGNLTTATGSGITFNMSKAGSPLLVLDGTLRISGRTNVTLTGNYQSDGVYLLATYKSLAGNVDNLKLIGTGVQYRWLLTGSGLNLCMGDSLVDMSTAGNVLQNGIGDFSNSKQQLVVASGQNITVNGTVTPMAIYVDGSKDTVFKSGTKGAISGAAVLSKEGTGKLTINTSNPNWTGDVNISAGSVVAGTATALGKGTVTLTGGTLNMSSFALANTVNVNGASAVINGGAKYKGNLTLTKGTLSGQNINLYSGKTATLKSGTVKNVLAGAGKVVKDTTGTVYVYGANTYKGGTTVKAGALVAKNVKAFGTGGIIVTGGTLHMGSYALTNTVNVNGTSAVINCASAYRGNLYLTKGALSGQNINLYTGKTATLRAGSVKNTLVGSGKVVKDTTGTVYMYGANTYKGGTTLKAGSLCAKNTKALGAGAVTMTGGSLYLNSLAVVNAINVNASSASIKGGSRYKGRLTLTKGTLSGDKINVVSGKNAYLKLGTVKNPLTGTGHVYKQGKGTVTLAGANNWTGNTYVQGGTLVLTGFTVLRGTTGVYAGSKLDVRRAVTLGNLYLGGGTLALKAGNMLTITGTLTLANATKLALSGVTASSPVLIKYGRLNNKSKKSLNQFFGLSSAYIVTNKGGKLTIAKAGAKKGTAEFELEETFTVSPNALGQGTWGTARAARLFDHTVRDHAQAQSVALDKNRSVWFAGMSGFSHVDDAADTNIYGGAVGMQFNGSMGGNAGIAIGQTYGHVSPAGATRVKQQTQHAALYGTKMLYTSATDSVSLTGTASYGTTDSDHETLDWTQHSAVLGVRGTWEHKVGKSTAVYGFAGLEYLATDSGSGSGSIQTLQGSIGAGISHTEGRLTLHVDASFTPDMVRNAPSGTVNPGRLGFEVGAGATYHLSDKWSLNAGYTYHNEKHADSHEAYIGARCTF